MKLIKTSDLNQAQKQKLWTGIKTKQPELAELLKSDTVQQLIAEFDASPAFNSNEIMELMK